MKKFIFDLQGVLEIKQKLEGQARVDFGVARSRLTAEEEKKEALVQQRNGYAEELRETMTGPLNIKEMNRLKNAVDVMNERIRVQDAAVKRAERQVESARIKLNKVVQERKTIEKLREKKFEEYMKEIDAEESKTVDELVSYRYTSASSED
ncbi:MAG: flagellar export protein FliJ [Lachnospiraceae bacterium]|nr:flagellar export protein FliJ [Lachnospiraceae bacterium]